jgi:hypothetical protein
LQSALSETPISFYHATFIIVERVEKEQIAKKNGMNAEKRHTFLEKQKKQKLENLR